MLTNASCSTVGTREAVAAALQTVQSRSEAASPTLAQLSGSNPDACILGVWLPPDAAAGTQQPADQESAEGRRRGLTPHGVGSQQHRTPRKAATATAAAAGTAPDSIARRTRSRLRGDAGGTTLAVPYTDADAAAAMDADGPANRAASRARAAVGDGSIAECTWHIAVACAEPCATRSSSGSGSGWTADSMPDVPSAAAGTPVAPPLLQGIWLGGRRLSPAACHVILYQQPAAGRSRLRVASAAGGTGGRSSEAAAVAARSSTPGGALQWAVDCLNGSRQLIATLAAAQAHPAATQQRRQAGPPWPADAARPGASDDAGVKEPPLAAKGLLAYSELWQELQIFRQRYQNRSTRRNNRLQSPAAAAGGLHLAADLHAASARGTAGSTPEAASDAAAADPNTVRGVQRRAAAWLSHAAGLAAGCYLLARRQRLAQLVGGLVAALAWRFIDPQASSQQPVVACGQYNTLRPIQCIGS